MICAKNSRSECMTNSASYKNKSSVDIPQIKKMKPTLLFF